MIEFIDPYAPKDVVKAASTEGTVLNDSLDLTTSSVPKGTTREILAWVGDDKERAVQALDTEALDNTPRKGLVRELFERAGDMADIRNYPQFGGYDNKGGTGGSAVPEKQTILGGEGDETSDGAKTGVEPNKGGQEPTHKSSVPADQEADAGKGDADQGAQADGTKGGHDSTYGSSVPADQVASADPTKNESFGEFDRPESAKDYADAPAGERAEDIVPAQPTQGVE